MIKVAILTVSDSCSQHKRQDISGQTIKKILAADKFQIAEYKIVADEDQSIKKALIHFADELKVDIVLTTGGTGLGPRDVTPEATAAVCRRMVPGLAEAIRLEGLKNQKRCALTCNCRHSRKYAYNQSARQSQSGGRVSRNNLRRFAPRKRYAARPRA